MQSKFQAERLIVCHHTISSQSGRGVHGGPLLDLVVHVLQPPVVLHLVDRAVQVRIVGIGLQVLIPAVRRMRGLETLDPLNAYTKYFKYTARSLSV